MFSVLSIHFLNFDNIFSVCRHQKSKSFRRFKKPAGKPTTKRKPDSLSAPGCREGVAIFARRVPIGKYAPKTHRFHRDVPQKIRFLARNMRRRNVNWSIRNRNRCNAQISLAGGDEGVGIDESTPGGIVITTLEIIEACFLDGCTAIRSNFAPSPQVFKPENLG